MAERTPADDVSVAIGDLDGVNGPDLRVTRNVSVLLNQGDGTFAEAVTYLENRRSPG